MTDFSEPSAPIPETSSGQFVHIEMPVWACKEQMSSDSQSCPQHYIALCLAQLFTQRWDWLHLPMTHCCSDAFLYVLGRWNKFLIKMLQNWQSCSVLWMDQ